MDMNLCEDGEIEKGDIDHFVARAAGGTGLIITGCCAVAYPLGCTSRKEPGLSEDRFIPGLKALADAVHDAGSKLCVQMDTPRQGGAHRYPRRPTAVGPVHAEAAG